MHIVHSYKLMQLMSSFKAKILNLSLSPVVLQLDQANMDFIGLEITMPAGNILEDPLLIISTIKCLDFKWLDLIFVALVAIPMNNSVLDGSK